MQRLINNSNGSRRVADSHPAALSVAKKVNLIWLVDAIIRGWLFDEVRPIKRNYQSFNLAFLHSNWEAQSGIPVDFRERERERDFQLEAALSLEMTRQSSLIRESQLVWANVCKAPKIDVLNFTIVSEQPSLRPFAWNCSQSVWSRRISHRIENDQHWSGRWQPEWRQQAEREREREREHRRSQ